MLKKKPELYRPSDNSSKQKVHSRHSRESREGSPSNQTQEIGKESVRVVIIGDSRVDVFASVKQESAEQPDACCWPDIYSD